MKVQGIYLIIVLAVLLQSCRYIAMDFTDSKLRVINNSDYNIQSVVNFEYPDTAFINSDPNNYVSSKDTGQIVVVNDYWTRVIKEVKVITVFFVKRDSLHKYGIYNWRKNVQPLKKMVLSEAQLDSLNWTLTYP